MRKRPLLVIDGGEIWSGIEYANHLDYEHEDFVYHVDYLEMRRLAIRAMIRMYLHGWMDAEGNLCKLSVWRYHYKEAKILAENILSMRIKNK